MSNCSTLLFPLSACTINQTATEKSELYRQLGTKCWPSRNMLMWIAKLVFHNHKKSRNIVICKKNSYFFRIFTKIIIMKHIIYYGMSYRFLAALAIGFRTKHATNPCPSLPRTCSCWESEVYAFDVKGILHHKNKLCIWTENNTTHATPSQDNLCDTGIGINDQNWKKLNQTETSPEMSACMGNIGKIVYMICLCCSKFEIKKTLSST